MGGKILILMLCMVLLVGTVSAADWDNTLTYSNNDLKVELKNWFGLGVNYGSVTLASHKTVDEIREVSIGKDQVVMYYDFNFTQEYTGGLGEVTFYDLKEEKYLNKNYGFMYWGEETIEIYGDGNCNNFFVNGTGYNCEKVIIGEETIKKWLPYKSLDIPTNPIRIGLKVDVEPNQIVDAVWTIGGKEVKKHASFTGVGEHSNYIVNVEGNVQNLKIKLKALTNGVITEVMLGSGDSSASTSNISIYQNNIRLAYAEQATWKYDTAPHAPIGLSNYSDVIYPTVDGGTFYVLINKTAGANMGEDQNGAEFNGSLFEYASQSLTAKHASQAVQPIFTFNQTAPDDVAPIVTDLYPVNNSNFTTATITANATISDNFNLTKVEWYIDGVLNKTNNTQGLYNASVFTFSTDLSDGTHRLQFNATDNATTKQSTLGNLTYVNIDTLDPTQTINTPVANETIYHSLYNVSLNATTSDANIDTCWYSIDDYATNTSYTCNNLVNVSVTTEGYYTLYACVNDTFGRETCGSVTNYLNYIRYNTTYTDQIIEGNTDTITFNLTATAFNTLTAILNYNNTNYSMISGVSNGTYGNFTATITAPTVSHNTNIPLYVYWTLNNVTNTTASENQTVLYITPLEVAEACSAGLSRAMHFNFTDANNLTKLENVTVDYNFQMGITNTSEKVTTGSLVNISEFSVCINASVYNNYTLGYGEVDYSRSGYSDRRWYSFNTQRLSNTSVNTTLYSLDSSSSTSFLITIQEPSLTPYRNIYTTLLRWYPALNEYKVVEMGKTDEKGQTVKKVQVEDTDYRIGVYYVNGTLIYLASPIRMVCVTSPCTYTLTVISASGVAYSERLGVEDSLIYSSGVFTYTYNDPSQQTSLMELNVSKVSGDTESLICYTNSSAFTGVLSCNVSTYSGLLKATAYRSASPFIPLEILWVDTINTVFQSTTGLFFMMIITLTLFLIGMYYPIASLILGLVALIPAIFLKTITYPIFIALAVLTGIVIYFMKETR